MIQLVLDAIRRGCPRPVKRFGALRSATIAAGLQQREREADEDGHGDDPGGMPSKRAVVGRRQERNYQTSTTSRATPPTTRPDFSGGFTRACGPPLKSPAALIDVRYTLGLRDSAQGQAARPAPPSGPGPGNGGPSCSCRRRQACLLRRRSGLWDEADRSFLFQDRPANILERGDLLSSCFFFDVAVGEAFAA
jgi:hypothetical protein